MKRIGGNLAILFGLLILTSCNGKKATDNSVGSSDQGVCVWDNVSLRETHEKNGKWLSSISIGETVEYLDESYKDDSSAKKVEYLKIRLKDGKEGWVRSDFIVLGAKPAVVVEQASVYKRPDLLNKTDKNFDEMDIIAVKSEKDDFIEVVGKRSSGKWIETCWIKKDVVSYSEVDIATAKYAKKALAIKDESEKMNALIEIVNNPDLSQSVFIAKLNSMINFTDEMSPDDFEGDPSSDEIVEETQEVADSTVTE
jgi:hypothetical protein